MITDLRNAWKRNLDNFAVSNLHLDARRGECLRSFHAVNCSPYPSAVRGNNLDVVLAVKRCKCRKCLRDFHSLILRLGVSSVKRPKLHLYSARYGCPSLILMNSRVKKTIKA